MGGNYLSQFNGNVKLYFYNTVDKKTPTAKKGTNLAVGLSRTRVQETFNLNLDYIRRQIHHNTYADEK